MSFSVGIVGLPNVGKSTLFKALTKNPVDISNYPFCTIDPNIGIVKVPDERLEKIAEIIKPEKVTPTVIEFVDIAGLVKGAHKGEGLGNQFLSRIREVDAIIHLVRYFKDENVAHPSGEINPKEDIEIVNTELVLRDVETVKKRTEKLKKEVKAGSKEAQEELAVLDKVKNILEKNQLLVNNLDEEGKEQTKFLQLLTIKPIIYLFNVNEDQKEQNLPDINNKIVLPLKLEVDLSEFSEQDLKELEAESHLDKLIKNCYRLLNLITFYTITGEKETRAWTMKKGSLAPKAGGVVHSDFEEKFIRAEVISWEELVEAGSWTKAKELGLVRTEGKEYEVKDGDIVEFKI